MLQSIRLSQRALQFYAEVFKPRFESLQEAARKTPLIVMLWGPSVEWYRQRMDIRDALAQHGHQVIFREDIGISSGMVPPRAIDLIDAQNADLAIVVQSAYGSIGDVQHFAEFRVIESKMLIFIDEAAPDRRSYLPAVAQLQLLYNNVETFKSPEEMIKRHVLEIVLNKVAVFQMVKYRALHSARRWGLNLQNYTSGAIGNSQTPRAFPYNLPELYREHRHEIDVLTDPTSLYLLALVIHIRAASHKVLSHDTGIIGPALNRKLAPLTSGGMVADSSGMLRVTDLGKAVLSEIGFPPFEPPVTRSVPAAPQPKRFPVRYLAAGLFLSVIAICFLAILAWFNITQAQQPAVLTPSRPAVTAPIVPARTPTVR